MLRIFLNNCEICQCAATNYNEIINIISARTQLQPLDFYLLQNGQRLTQQTNAAINENAVHCVLRLPGGKGGFGSMLRAIGAQIEKTTNREACRDLSGRRLRDINEEKRLKAWIEKQAEREKEAEERKKRKIEKLLAMPKHEFKDEQYEEARAKMTEKVNDAVEEGFKKAMEATAASSSNAVETAKTAAKRKATTTAATATIAKKPKGALWLGADISSGSDDDSDSNDEAEQQTKQKDKSI